MRKFVAPNTGHAGAWNKRCKSTSCQILFSPYLANGYHMGDIRVHRLPAAPPPAGCSRGVLTNLRIATSRQKAI